MTLYEEWKDMLENQSDETFEDFWKEYSDAEMTIYGYVLSHHKTHLKGTIAELSEKFKCKPAIFVGFLDGVETSLKKPIKIEEMADDTEIDLSIDFEKLYFNMQKADAPHLFGLPEWEKVLTDEQREKITKDFKRSKIYHAPVKIGRNDPCPCGSGKKYKNCCGKNA